MSILSFFNKKEESLSSDETNISSVDIKDKKDGETYIAWGHRVCAIVSGSHIILPTFLKRAYNYSHCEQINDICLQNKHRKEIEENIANENNELEDLIQQLNSSNQEIEENKNRIEDRKREMAKITEEGYKPNKDARMKLRIGLIVLIPITIYLFLFYSSTFYSAFFRNSDKVTNVFTSMFDPNAIANAFNDGFMELLLVLSAPVIFLGLGYILHYFAIQKERIRYLKMAIIVGFTFCFDCLLAYLIGKTLHELGVMTGSIPEGDIYNLSKAVKDPNIWAVIFCGFVVYMIWGLVFDMIMSAYDRLDLNKTKIEAINKQVAGYDQKIKDLKQTNSNQQKDKTKKENEINKLKLDLTQTTWFNKDTIKKDMTDFFTGWITQMSIIGCSSKDQSDVSHINDITIKKLFDEPLKQQSVQKDTNG